MVLEWTSSLDSESQRGYSRRHKSPTVPYSEAFFFYTNVVAKERTIRRRRSHFVRKDHRVRVGRSRGVPIKDHRAQGFRGTVPTESSKDSSVLASRPLGVPGCGFGQGCARSARSPSAARLSARLALEVLSVASVRWMGRRMARPYLLFLNGHEEVCRLIARD